MKILLVERGKTTVYIDGKKTGEAHNPMICPLRWFGSKTGHSFVGKVRNLRLYDRLSSKGEPMP